MKSIIALFDSRALADQARADLVQAGFPAAKIITNPEAPAGQVHEKSFWDSIKDFFGFEDTGIYQEASRRGGVLLSLPVEDERADKAVDILQRHHPVDVDQRVREWRRAGWKPAEAAPGNAQVIPVASEQLHVDKRRESRGGLRVYTHVREEPVERTLQLREEHVQVERRPADRPADAGAFQEQTFEFHEMHEEPVIRKEARVNEEVVIGKDVRTRTEKVQEKLRKTDVKVEELDNEFRTDYDTAFAGKGYTYDQVRPAYDFGTELAGTTRPGDRDWKMVSPEARRSFQQRYPNNQWEVFEPAVRYGFDRACRTRASKG